MSMFSDLLASLSLRRTVRSPQQVVSETRPSEQDLALQTLRRKYREYLQSRDADEKESRLFQLVPLFNKTCSIIEPVALVEKFEEIFDFAENVTFFFVRHVTQLAQNGPATLLEYFEQDGDNPSAGVTFLKAISTLSRGPETVVNAMMSSNLSSILVRCIHLFLDLPFSSSSSPVEKSVLEGLSSGGGKKTRDGAAGSPVRQRANLQKIFIRVLNRLLRFDIAVRDLLQFDDLQLLFGAISSPCPPHNKIWRRAASETLMTICRHNLSNDVIMFIHKKSCINFCIRNINHLTKTQPPLELVEILVAITCCLKDSADFSQMLIDDFSKSGGYEFLYKYLLMLEEREDQDSLDAQRNIVLLVSDIVTCGFVQLQPTLSDPGPFNPNFKVPVPAENGNTVRNKDAFLVLQTTFLCCTTGHLGKMIIDVILNIYKCDPANYFILESQQTLSTFLESLTDKNEDIQAHVFILLEFVIVELSFVPTGALTSLGLLLDKRDHPRTMCLALNYIVKFISHRPFFKDVYREAGILCLITNALKTYYNQLKLEEEEEEKDGKFNAGWLTPVSTNVGVGPLHSPSLPLDNLVGETEECVFLIVECLRAIIEGNEANGKAFQEPGGSACILGMVKLQRFRRMALRLLTQLILLEEGHVHVQKLLDLLNTADKTAVALRIDILQTVLGVFQLNSSRKAMFRDGCGFHYLISVLTSLYESLGLVRPDPWDKVPQSEILHLIQLVFTVLTAAMQDDPANKLFFDSNIRFESFSAPLRLLGCFAKEAQSLSPLPRARIICSQPSVDSEFGVVQAPSTSLDPNSFIYAASEIFRFLRDMALGISPSQSLSFVLPPDQHLAAQSKKLYSNYLIHPGAVLCMVDLIPAVDYDLVVTQAREVECNTPKDLLDEVTPPLTMLDVPAMKILTTPAEEASKGDIGDGGAISEDEYGRQWCLYLQDRVLREIYLIAGPERNQQCLCQVGLPGRLLLRGGCGLSSETHPLHQVLERTFEKLSYQALTPADFRNFLRLGEPLCCAINDVPIEELSRMVDEIAGDESSGEEDFSVEPVLSNELDEARKKADSPVDEVDFEPADVEDGLEPSSVYSSMAETKGKPLSLARIQSLVSMTTPRDGILSGISIGSCPPFVEFDMSMDGFGCLFLPSVFPQTLSAQSASGGIPQTTGIGMGGERAFPPSNGLTYSVWLCMFHVQPDEKQPINLLTLSQCFLNHNKTLQHYPLLRIYLLPSEKCVYVSTQIPRDHRDSIIEDYIHKDDRKEKSLEVKFPCDQLSHSSLRVWYHVAITLQTKGLRGKAKATLFVNGVPIGNPQKLLYIHPLPAAVSAQFLAFPTDSSPYMINAHIGTHINQRCITKLVYRLGPSYLFDEPLSAVSINHIYHLGPMYIGSFQNPMHGNVSTGSHWESSGALVQEERIVFGLVAERCSNFLLSDLLDRYQYSPFDISTIAKELSLADEDSVTPVMLLNNSVLHLSGPARCVGAIVCGYAGIRTFEPQPLRSLLSAIGGTSVVLGLVAMATDVDSLYAGMKAMVCIVGNNSIAIKEMERMGGFKLLGMLLRSKSHLVNSNILHLTFTLVGTVNSEHESACIPNSVPFKDLLADQSVWKEASEDIQKSLCQHFYDLLMHSSDKENNAHKMLAARLIPELLMRLHDRRLTDSTLKAFINVINALMGHRPSEEDVRRFGQLLASYLPRDFTNETDVSLYGKPTREQDIKMTPDPDFDIGNMDAATAVNYAGKDFPDGTDMREALAEVSYHIVKRRIRLRNMLLDVLLSHLMTVQNEFDSNFAHQVVATLGFDWLLLFLQPQVHIETVVRALRILVCLLSESSIRKRFLSGNIYGGWLHGIQSVLPDYASEIKKTLLFSVSRTHRPELQLPGALLLSRLLPQHLKSSQTFLLVIALMLGVPVIEVPYSAPFDLESLDAVFNIRHGSSQARKAGAHLCPEAVHVLLAMTRELLHQEKGQGDRQVLVMAKFLEQLYHNVNVFQHQVATSQEFTDSLAATLFPPSSIVKVQEGEDNEEDEFVLLPPASPSTVPPSSQTSFPPNAPAEIPPALLRNNKSAVLSIIKLLRMVVVDGFNSSLPGSQRGGTTAECPMLEQVLEAYPAGISPDLQKNYQTAILCAVMKHLEEGNEDVLVVLKDAGNFPKMVVGFHVFCMRLVDKLWSGVYSKPSDTIYAFLHKMVEQALTKPKHFPLNELQRALNRAILYQVSSVPQTEPEQKELVDTLCQISSHSHLIFDETNTDVQFLRCLLYRLLMLVFTDQQPFVDISTSLNSSYHSNEPSSSVEEGLSPPKQATHGCHGYKPIMSHSLLRSAANRLWSKILEHKRLTMETLLGLSLPVPASRSYLAIPQQGQPQATGTISARSTTPGNPQMSLSDLAANIQVSIGNPAFTKLQNCKEFLQDQTLEKTWNEYHTSEQQTARGVEAADPIKERGLIRTLLRRKHNQRISGRDPGMLVEEYISWHCPQLVVTAHKFEDAIQRNHQRHQDYKLRFTASEWARLEHELTRERGLWGPDQPSTLDKWMLDAVEGPSRMRKRLCRNYLFYEDYKQDIALAKKFKKHRPPTSYDVPLWLARHQLFPMTSLLSLNLPSSLPSSHIATTTPRVMEDSLLSSSTHRLESFSKDQQSPALRGDFLSNLDNDDPVARTLFKMVDLSDKITEQYQCARLVGLDSQDGLLLFGTTNFYVVQGITLTNEGSLIDVTSANQGRYNPVVPQHLQSSVRKKDGDVSIGCIKWSYSQVREVHKRRYLLRHCALEVFSNDGQSMFLIFHPPQKEKIYQRLFSLAKPSDQQQLLVDPEMNHEHVSTFFSVITGRKTLMQIWESGEITNFQYLMHLNTLAGRSYNDLMQYPVFPWVIADYDSPVLDLSDPKSFRDFSKPMGAQTPKRLTAFIERFRHFEDPMGETNSPYYYGTHYSSAMSVASFLVRMEPFTQYFITLQGGHFDLPDRMFHSIPEAWKSSSLTNMADIKELIPEFFYLPEFLLNCNNFDFGVKQNQECLGDVVLPPWAKGDPYEFVRVNREALESDYVSAHLHEWIDLVFGYKQQGKEAEKAHNVFHPLFYEGTVDIDNIEDPLRKKAAISFIHNFGQMPKQLFKRPHRQRKVISRALQVNQPADVVALTGTYTLPVFFKNIIQLMPSREPVKEVRGEVGQILSMSERQVLMVDRRKILLPPHYNRYLAWGFWDQSLRIALLEQDKVVSVYEGLQQGRILCAAVLGESILLTAGESTVVHVWKMRTTALKGPTELNLKHTLHGHTGHVTCLATSSSFNLIVSGSRDKTCILWDANKWLFVRQLSHHNSPVSVVTINQLSGNIVSCTRNEIRLWTVNGDLLARSEIAITGNFRLLCCAVSEMFEWDKDNVIITGSSDGIVRFWRLDHIKEGDYRYSSSHDIYSTASPPPLSGYPSVSDVTQGRPVRPARPLSVTSVSSSENQQDGTSSPPGSPVSTLPPEACPGEDEVDGSEQAVYSIINEEARLTETSDTESAEALLGLANREEHAEELESNSDSHSLPEDKMDEFHLASMEKEVDDTDTKPSTADMAESRDNCPDIKSAAQLLLDEAAFKARQKATELREKTGQWRRKLVLIHTLTMHTSFQRHDNYSPAAVTCLSISKDHRKLFVGDARGRVFTWSVADSQGGAMEHWIQDEAVTKCMKCEIEFTITERKHHCRDCGKIFCAKCSDFQNVVERLRINKKVRVCFDCHNKLSRHSSPRRTPQS